MTERRICIHCRHAYGRLSYLFCFSPKLPNDPVQGGVVPKLCKDARGIGGHCGPDGINFELKIPMKWYHELPFIGFIFRVILPPKEVTSHANPASGTPDSSEK